MTITNDERERDNEFMKNINLRMLEEQSVEFMTPADRERYNSIVRRENAVILASD